MLALAFTAARLRTTTLALLPLIMAGCANSLPSGYGLQEGQSTAAQAQQQIEAAEQANQPNTAQTYLDLIGQMQQAGQWYASLAHADAFEQQYGERAQSRLMRADALRNTGQNAGAKALYEALIGSEVAAQARRGLGLLYATQGDYAQAIEQFEQARVLNPINASVLSDMAYAYMLSGNLAAARVPALQAAQLAPNDARIQLNLVLYFMAQGQQAQAQTLMQRLSQPLSKGSSALVNPSTASPMLERQLQKVRQASHAQPLIYSWPAPAAGATPQNP